MYSTKNECVILKCSYFKSDIIWLFVDISNFMISNMKFKSSKLFRSIIIWIWSEEGLDIHPVSALALPVGAARPRDPLQFINSLKLQGSVCSLSSRLCQDAEF